MARQFLDSDNNVGKGVQIPLRPSEHAVLDVSHAAVGDDCIHMRCFLVSTWRGNDEGIRSSLEVGVGSALHISGLRRGSAALHMQRLSSHQRWLLQILRVRYAPCRIALLAPRSKRERQNAVLIDIDCRRSFLTATGMVPYHKALVLICTAMCRIRVDGIRCGRACLP
jgi:hypothetical protein